jgi:hypothetical protein
MRVGGAITPGTGNIDYTSTAPSMALPTDVGPGTFGGDINGTGIMIQPAGSIMPNQFNTMPFFALGSWYIKLATPQELHICDILICKPQMELDI